MNKTKKTQSEKNFIPIQKGTPDITGYGQLKLDVERINTRMEVVVYALFIAFIVALIAVFGIFIDAYKFHAESYKEFKQTLNEQQNYNKDYKSLENSVNELTKQVREINSILKNK